MVLTSDFWQSSYFRPWGLSTLQLDTIVSLWTMVDFGHIINYSFFQNMLFLRHHLAERLGKFVFFYWQTRKSNYHANKTFASIINKYKVNCYAYGQNNYTDHSNSVWISMCVCTAVFFSELRTCKWRLSAVQGD